MSSCVTLFRETKFVVVVVWCRFYGPGVREISGDGLFVPPLGLQLLLVLQNSTTFKKLRFV